MAPHAEEPLTNGEVNGVTTTLPSEEKKKPDVNGKTNKSKNKGKGKGKPKKDSQENERIQRLDQLYSKKKRQKYFVPTAKSTIDQEEDLSGKSSHVVLKVRRIIGDKGYPMETEIDIKSTLLKEVLSEIWQGVEGLKLNQSPPVASPELLFYSKEGLEKRVRDEEAKTTPNKMLIDELSVALQFVAEDYGQKIETLASLGAHGEITFELLWTLFPPNTTVWTKDNHLHEDQIIKLQSGEYKTRCNGSKYFALDCRILSHDGQKFGWAEKSWDVDFFEGARKVHNLSCLPLSHHPNQQTVRGNLIKRGRRYLELLEATYQEYNGAAIAENREVYVGDEYKKFPIHVFGRIMLDPPIFQQQNECTDLLKPTINTEVLQTSLTDDDVLFCNYYVPGFSFQQKRWLLFAITRMSPVVWNPNAFSKLVMDTRKRDLIHSLVKSHRNGSETFDDIVSGKGKGLVGLLSGNPGVGKTLTAEVIAEVTRRPLYILSAGEMGTHAYDVERKLDTVLEVTRVWGCVLLIDEADVFLQERDDVNLERNALVSVFLRRLEYFQGVLIMTTNRKRTIDTAFDSRIHFKLHYADLTPASRVAIWRNCLENIPAAVSKTQIGDEELEELARLGLNGRQIKNAVACAVSIAAEEKKPLTLEGIQMILALVIDTDMDGVGHLYQ